MTLLEYFNTPETVLPQELIDGAMYVADAPAVSHQRALLRFALALHEHADEVGGELLIAPTGVILDERRPVVLQPDLLYLAPGRGHLALDRVYGAPDLVIEILSPRARVGDLDQRVRLFAEYGVREVWLYDQTTRRMNVLRCEGGAVRETAQIGDGPMASDVLPTFTRTIRGILDTGGGYSAGL